MTRQEAETALTSVIVEIQEMSGRDYDDIGPGTKPIGDVPGFDSLNGLEATVEVAARLKMNIPNEANIFTNKAGDQALSLREIGDRLIEISKESEETTRAK